MAMYRKKPLLVEAVLVEDPETALVALVELGAKDVSTSRFPPGLLIETLEGTMRADIGYWVVRGVEGEFYPVKPEIFAKTYDKVVA